jgi:pilus assembly protein TadC
MGGNAALQIGSRYLLTRVGTKLHLLGPIHISPSAVAARVTLANADVAVLSDRLLITGRAGSDLSLAFSSVVAEPGVDLEQQLLVRTKRKAVAT